MRRPNIEQQATVALSQMPGQNVKYKKRGQEERRRKEGKIENETERDIRIG